MPLKDFVTATPRQLPVLILADVSGSMFHEGKIETLNRSVGEMVRSFAALDETTYEITVGVITFGGTAQMHCPLTPACDLVWRDMVADGMTPLGQALTIACEILEDRTQLQSRSAKPVLVLVSDGLPNDDWETPLNRLLSAPRASKATRFSVAIGNDVDEEAMSVLEQFASADREGVFRAENAHRIVQFFNWLTMSVSQQATEGAADFAPLADRSADIVVD
jgi:uncharacterized protein YegL